MPLNIHFPFNQYQNNPEKDNNSILNLDNESSFEMPVRNKQNELNNDINDSNKSLNGGINNLTEEIASLNKADNSNVQHNDLKANFSSGEVKYFLNDEPTKYRLILNTMSVSNFTAQIRIVHKLESDFAVFLYDLEEGKLRILKEGSGMKEECIYYVIENKKVRDVYKKIEKRAIKDISIFLNDKSKRQVFTSYSYPLRVDFIPESELYLNQIGRLGLCMAPGRNKKSSHKIWIRDIEKDLNRLKEVYQCDVLVSLIRHSELHSLGIPTLFEDAEKRGIESIHFPIKDKWVPDSMTELIKLVDLILQRLKQGKTVVLHCNGGKGRSGTVAVACLVAMGKTAPKSIEVVRKARSGTIRNPLQVLYVKRFKKAWLAYHRKVKHNEEQPYDINEIDNIDDSWDELDSCVAFLNELEENKTYGQEDDNKINNNEGEKKVPSIKKKNSKKIDESLSTNNSPRSSKLDDDKEKSPSSFKKKFTSSDQRKENNSSK